MKKNETMKNNKKMQICVIGKASASTLGMPGPCMEAYLGTNQCFTAPR